MTVWRVVRVYRSGAENDGWGCQTCQRQWPHHRHPVVVFLAFLDHLVLDHHRFPRRPGLMPAPRQFQVTYHSSGVVWPAPGSVTMTSAPVVNHTFAGFEGWTR